jgi:phage/plasmid primase, P4 family, C-terminal domain
MGRKKKAAANSPSGSQPRPTHYDLDQVRGYARGQWPAILSSLGGIDVSLLDGNHHHCPKCGGTDRFRLIDEPAGAVLCNNCARTGIGDGFASLAWITGRKFADVLAQVADYLGIEPTATPHHYSNGKATNADPAEHLSFQPWNDAADQLVALWCLTKPPITPAAVRAVGAQIARYRDQYTVIALPIHGENFREADQPGYKPVGWSLYNITGGPLPKFSKRVGDKPAKVEWVKVKMTYGSKPGIITCIPRLLTAIEHKSPKWKVEGPSDLLALFSLPDLHATTAIITNANGAGEQPPAWIIELFAGVQAYVCHDADQPGQRGALGYRDTQGRPQHPGWAPAIAVHATECRNIQLPFPIEETHGRDLRDYLNQPKTYRELLDLVDLAQPVAPADLSIAPPPRQALEEDDDPHRLARVNLDSYSAQADGATIRYWREEWYTWKPSRACYRKIETDELRAKITASIKAEFDRLWHEEMAEYEAWRKSAEYDRDEDKGPPRARRVKRDLVANVLAATGSLTCIPSSVELMTWISEGIRERRPYIAMLNGLIDLDKLLADADESEVILPHSHNWFSTVRLPYAFDPSARCPKWDAFLERNLELDPERIKILQEWAGYCLTPDTGQQKFLAMEGEGSNGKSVYCAAISAMLGAENCSHIPLEKFGERFDLTQTIGKLVNICADVGEIDKAAEGQLKGFTSGDVMFFDRKKISGVECLPTARLVLSFNNRPRFSDRSQGVWRRMLLIPWNIQITEDERIPNMDKGWWWQRQGELPGILNWAIEGLHRLRAQGRFTASTVGQEAIESYRDEVNPARLFLKEHFQASDSSVRCAFAYKFYVKWCEQTGHRPFADVVFGREVKRVFPNCERKRVRHGQQLNWNYFGIAFQHAEILGEKTSDDTLF